MKYICIFNSLRPNRLDNTLELRVTGGTVAPPAMAEELDNTLEVRVNGGTRTPARRTMPFDNAHENYR